MIIDKADVVVTIKRRRQEMGLSVNAAAKLSDITQPAWQRVEAGRREARWDTLFAMAAALGMTVVVEFDA